LRAILDTSVLIAADVAALAGDLSIRLGCTRATLTIWQASRH
jgi:hypothetical protein